MHSLYCDYERYDQLGYVYVQTQNSWQTVFCVFSGSEFGSLDGVPFSAKDNFSTQGVQTGCASRMLQGEMKE